MIYRVDAALYFCFTTIQNKNVCVIDLLRKIDYTHQNTREREKTLNNINTKYRHLFTAQLFSLRSRHVTIYPQLFKAEFWYLGYTEKLYIEVYSI